MHLSCRSTSVTPDGRVWRGYVWSERKTPSSPPRKIKKINKPGRTPQYKQKIGFDKKFTAVSDCANCAERKNEKPPSPVHVLNSNSEVILLE